MGRTQKYSLEPNFFDRHLTRTRTELLITCRIKLSSCMSKQNDQINILSELQLNLSLIGSNPNVFAKFGCTFRR